MLLKVSLLASIIAASVAQVPSYFNVSISTAWNDAFVIEPQAPIQAGSALLLQSKTVSPSQTFNITSASTSLQVAGTNLCIDAGTGRTNGSPITLTACNNALASQKWTFNSNGFLQITGTNYCADLYLGAVRSGTRIVLWQCISGDKNHMWKAQNITAPVPPPT